MAASILLVHGDPAVSELISRVLGTVGRSCVSAPSVEAALEALRGGAFGVVLLSPQVGSGRGHIVLEALAQAQKERRTPVVLLGEGAAGFDHPVVPLPPGDDFVERVLAPERERVLAGAERALSGARDAAARERARVSEVENHLNDVELQLAVARADGDRLGRELDAAKTGRTRLEANLATARSEGVSEHAQVEALRARVAELEEERDALAGRLAAEQAQRQGALGDVRALEDRLSHAGSAHAAQLETVAEHIDALGSEHQAQLDALRAEHASQLEAGEARLTASRAEHAAQLASAQARVAAAEARFADAQAAQAAEKERVEQGAATAQQSHAAELRALSEQLAQAEAARAASDRRTAEVAAAVEVERIRARGERAELDAARARAEAAESEAAAAQERLHDLETRTVLKFDAPDAPPSTVPRSGTVGLGELARLGVELWRARADVRLDLATPLGLRRLWLRRGTVAGAVSELPVETLAERARRDGLVDDRQAASLSGLSEASLRRQLDELLQRGMLRRAETEGLLLRYVEGVALEAFSAGETTYRLEHEQLEPPLPAPSQVRPFVTLIAQALRRALPNEGHVALVGGPLSVPRARPHAVDVELLGFSAREQRLLAGVDGERSVGSLAAELGLTPERACQALSVAKALGLVALDEGVPEGEDDAATLALKFEQVQSADYFTILGLTRAADASAVRRAQLQLSQQFDPLKFAGHPDPAVLHQAQVVYRHVKDAARALADDRRRADYARHLE